MLLLPLMIAARFAAEVWTDGPSWTWAVSAFLPALLSLVLVVWWLVFSRARAKERLLGLLAVIVILAAAATQANLRRAVSSSPVVFLLVPLVIFQGLLGMWTVTLLLKPLVVSAHLLGGLATLSLLWWNLLSVRGRRVSAVAARGLFWLARVAVLVLVLQIFLGGWTSANYAALSCTDFPTCQGLWWPHSNFREAYVLWRGLGINYEFGVLDTPARTAIHLGHRLGALFATLTVGFTALFAWRSGEPRLRRLASCILGALALQVCLGIANVLGGLPLPVAVAHNGVAAVLLLTLITLVHSTRRL